MPKKALTRQRIVYCDCLDCRDLPSDIGEDLTDEYLSVASAVARQVPHPPKALILYASGYLCIQEEGSSSCTSLDALTFPHLDRAVHDGCLGLLAVRSSTAADPSTCSLTELSQILGVHDEYLKNGTSLNACQNVPSLSERFKGMSAVFVSTSPDAAGLAASVGCTLASPSLALSATCCTGAQEATPSALPEPVQYADKLVSELGPEQGGSGPDLLMVHLDAQDLSSLTHNSMQHSSNSPGCTLPTQQRTGSNTGASTLQWLDEVVGRLLRLKAVRERVLLTIVVSAQGKTVPGGSGLSGASGSSRSPRQQAQHLQQQVQQLQQGGMQVGGAAIDPLARVVTPLSAYPGKNTAGQLPQGLDVLEMGATGGATSLVNRPVQSFQVCGMQKVDVALGAPAVVVRRLPGVIRRDRAERIKLSEAHQRGGQGTIMADRLLFEIAYKLGRAPKYGA